MKKNIASLLTLLVPDIFSVSSITYLGSLLINEYWQHFTIVFPARIFLWMALISGCFLFWRRAPGYPKPQQEKRYQVVFILLLSISSGALIFLKLDSYHFESYLLSISGIIALLLSSWIFIESNVEYGKSSSEEMLNGKNDVV